MARPAPTRSLAEGRPFVVAHRAGNDLRALRHAERLEIPLVELDVHLFRGRLEVRHLKTLGPVPVLWDRWRLAPGWGARLTLPQVLDATGPATRLMLDLKRGDHRLADRVAETVAARSAAARVTVCSRRWRLLERVERGAGVAIIHSVGSRRQLAALRRRFAGRRLHGVSIHRRLLDADTVADLRERARLVLAWPVATPTEAQRLAAWGVHGMISERYEALAAALGAGAAA